MTCAEAGQEHVVRERIEQSRARFAEVVARRRKVASAPLRDAALRYGAFAGEALNNPTCAFLALTSTEERRTKLDEEMTDTWIDRLHELHSDIEAKELIARAIGKRTTASGLGVALLGAVTAVFVARWTARSVTRPVARLASDATRLGDGNFAPIAPVDGPMEIEGLRRNLERTREKLLGVDRLKQAFLASVSHELRSPLGRLREALSLLADGTLGTLTPQQERVVKLPGRACEQEVRIVEALLDMPRVSSGHGPDDGLPDGGAVFARHLRGVPALLRAAYAGRACGGAAAVSAGDARRGGVRCVGDLTGSGSSGDEERDRTRCLVLPGSRDPRCSTHRTRRRAHPRRGAPTGERASARAPGRRRPW